MHTVPYHQGTGAGEISQSLQGSLRLSFLVERDAHYHEDEAHKHQSLLKVSQNRIDQAACHQEQEHRLLYHLQGDCEYAARFRLRQLIITKLFLLFCRLGP